MIDNLYFYVSAGISNGPLSAAPIPTADAAKVTFLFSDVYTDVTVDSWIIWSQATLEEISIDDNAVRKYSNLNLIGVKILVSKINASEMKCIYTEVWMADATEIRIKLLDFGADDAFQSGDDVRHEITITNPEKNTWFSVKLHLTTLLI